MSITFKQIEMMVGTKELFKVDQLVIPAGSRVGIVGDNGSGKTTLLQLVAGQTPTKGTVERDAQVTVIEQLLDETSTDSGGEQTKRRIQAAVRAQAGILLADEPTNHLDQHGIRFLEKALKRYPGTILVISHNRDFLNKVATKILAIEHGELKLYEGNYAAYLAQKERENREQARAYEKYMQEKAHIEQAIEGTAEKSRQVRKAPRRMGNSEARLHKMGDQSAKKSIDRQNKALVTRLEKLEVQAKPQEKRKLVIPFAEAQVIHRPYVLAVEDFTLQAGNKLLLEHATFRLLTGSKTALTGNNGSGKTTLLKTIMAGSEIPHGQGVRFGYFSQSFEDLNKDQSIWQNVLAATDHEEQAVRDLLAHLQFRGDSIFKQVGVLSGGERSKVAIAKLLLSNNNVLLLDEPTNHLDIASIEVLEEALQAYQGTILFISHDQTFIDHVATDYWQIKDRRIKQPLAEPVRSSGEETALQQQLLLENRKVELISRLSYPLPEQEKAVLEAEFRKVIEALRK